MFKIPTDCHMKTCGSLRRGAILEITSTVFFKMKPLRKPISNVKTKTNPYFAVKPC